MSKNENEDEEPYKSMNDDEKVDLLHERTPIENKEFIIHAIKTWGRHSDALSATIVAVLVDLHHEHQDVFDEIIERTIPKDDKYTYIGAGGFYRNEQVVNSLIDKFSIDQIERLVETTSMVEDAIDRPVLFRFLRSQVLTEDQKYTIYHKHYVYTRDSHHNTRKHTYRYFEDPDILYKFICRENTYDNIKYIVEERLKNDFYSYCYDHVHDYFMSEEKYRKREDRHEQLIWNFVAVVDEDEELFKDLIDNGSIKYDIRRRFYKKVSDVEFLKYHAIMDGSSQNRQYLIKRLTNEMDIVFDIDDLARIFSKETTSSGVNFIFEKMVEKDRDEAILFLKDKLFDDTLDVDIHKSLFRKLESMETERDYHNYLSDYFRFVVHTKTKSTRINKREMIRDLGSKLNKSNHIQREEKDTSFRIYVEAHVPTMHDTSFVNTIDIVMSFISSDEILYDLIMNNFTLMRSFYLVRKYRDLDITLEQILTRLGRERFQEIFLAHTDDDQNRKYLLTLKPQIAP